MIRIIMACGYRYLRLPAENQDNNANDTEPDRPEDIRPHLYRSKSSIDDDWDYDE